MGLTLLQPMYCNSRVNLACDDYSPEDTNSDAVTSTLFLSWTTGKRGHDRNWYQDPAGWKTLLLAVFLGKINIEKPVD